MYKEVGRLSAEYHLDVAFEPTNLPLMALMLWVAHGGALGCLFTVDLNGGVKSLLGIAIVLSLAYYLCYHAYRCTPRSITKIVWRNGKNWRLITRSGDIIEADLLPATFAHPLLVVLNFRAANRLPPISVILLPDTIATTELRRLRARLRCRGSLAEHSR